MIAPQNAAPSTLADVLGQVLDAFGEMGNATPIMIGKHYRDHGVGQPPHVIFVPEVGGRIGPPSEMGRAASIAHGCEVHVRGDESGDDLQRFRSAYELGDLVISCLQTAAPGRIEWSGYEDTSPTDVDAFGAELSFSFTYTRDVPHNAARWSLAAATADGSSKQVGVPPGIPGQVDSVAVTTVPKEP